MIRVSIEGYREKKIPFSHQTINQAFEEAYPNILTALRFKNGRLPRPIVNGLCGDFSDIVKKDKTRILMPVSEVNILIGKPGIPIIRFSVPAYYTVNEVLKYASISLDGHLIVLNGIASTENEQIYDECYVFLKPPVH